jgi:alpha-acetolactate decarboxylase
MSDVEGNYSAKANHQLVATGQATQVACPLTGRPAKPELKLDVSGVTVAFCSQACKTRAEKAEECARIELLFGNGVFDQGFRIRGGAAEIWDGTIVQFGKMHEAIGRQQNEGRVQVGALLERPHFFGIGALAKLKGEATIVDGTITLTRVDAKGQLEPRQPAPLDDKATLLIGAYVPSWSEQKVTANVGPDEFDHYIAESATRTGIKTSAPFVFTVEGEFRNVRLHVINGACPMHARLKKIEIPREFQPFEAELENVRGTVVGVFAKDAVGDITHPATSTHVHLVFKDDKSNNTVTGHVEQIGLREGAVLRLPKSK